MVGSVFDFMRHGETESVENRHFVKLPSRELAG